MKKYKIFYILFMCFFITLFLVPLSPAETGKTGQKISFNFVDVEIPTVIKFISELTGKNFIFDERVKGKITVIAPTELSVEESFSLFTSILELKGFTTVPSGTKAYKIIPSSLAKQTGRTFTDKDTLVNESYITRLLPVKHIKAKDAVQFIKPVVARNGHISAFGPGNLLLVVDSAVNINKVMSILKGIDQPPIYEEPAEVTVYPLENADATELAKVLEGVIRSSQTSKRMVQKTPVRSMKTQFADIAVTPDKATNSLIILASPSNYQSIARVIKTLDKKRRQVFVEAMIIEASIDKLKELGTKWRVTAKRNDQPVLIGGFGTLNSTSIQSILTGLTGFSLGGTGNFLDVPVTNLNTDGTVSSSTLTVPGFAALFDMSIFEGAINVLSTPQILTSDNEEAEIIVGENVPFISKRERDITTTNTVLSSIKRQDVGITLKITPQITEGDYVKLALYQEISSVKEGSENIITTVGPTTTKRATKTSIVVKDGQTVVISGLMQEKEEVSIAKTPLLGDIPILGWLFKHKSVTKKKTNLLIFITPHIVKDSVQLAEITEKKQRDFARQEKQYAENELLIKFKKDVSDEKALEIISLKGASVIKYTDSIKLYHIKLKDGQDVENAVEEFSSDPDVLYAEPNYRVMIHNNLSAPRYLPQQQD